MGDRGNVFVKEADVFLYGHWSGYSLAITVREALKRGRDRWSDSQYLSRIVFAEMTRGDVDGTTGFGISHTLGDNERPIIVLDTQAQTIAATIGRRDADVEQARDPMSFAKYCQLSDEQCREWHHGKGAE